jgi:hypothetical protein
MSSRSFVVYSLLEEYAPFSANSGNSSKTKGKLNSKGLDFWIRRERGLLPLGVYNMPVEDVDLKERIRAVKGSAVRFAFTMVQLIASITRLMSTTGKLEKCQSLSE